MRQDLKATWIEEDKLTEAFCTSCMDCMEVLTLEDNPRMIDKVQEIEKDNDCQFTGLQIVHSWREGANQCIDSNVDNLYGMWKADRIDEEEYDERVADWEAQRPENARRQQIIKSIQLTLDI